MTALTDPFDTVHKKDIRKDGVVVAQVDYVGWSQVADRLDAAAPGWSFSIRQLGDDWCWGQLKIGDRTFENIGYAENADAAWKKEALKDAVSDALKRCAAMAGVARYLYDKDSSVPAVHSSPRPLAAVAPSPVSRPAAVNPYAKPHDDPYPESLAELDAPVVDNTGCPVHGKPWKQNSRGYYCATKVGDGWCQEKPR